MKIVPQNRLLFWAALVLVPFGAIAGAGPAPLIGAGIVIGAFVALAGIDAVISWRRLAGIRTEFPEVIRLQKERAGTIEMRIVNESRRECVIRLGLALPPEIRSESETLAALLPEGASDSRLCWGCRPEKRGLYLLEEAFIERLSALGFWGLRARQSARSELRVYPDLFSAQKKVAAIFLNRGNYGMHARRAVGKGREFERLREYDPGDSLQDIHWKASARRGHLVTRTYQIERTQEVYVILDASRLSAREDAIERYVTTALLLGVAAEQQGDHFGLIIFDDKVRRFVRAKNGKAHFDACREALYTRHPKRVSPDFDELAVFIRTRIRKRALLVFLTALDDPLLAESFSRSMELLCRQHLILVNMLKPPGAEPLFTGAPVTRAAEIYERLGGHLRWHNLSELEGRLQRHGVRFHLLEKESLSAKIVGQYAEVKSRQLI